MASKSINILVKIWRQNGPLAQGAFEDHALKDISTDMSFLEMIDVLNEWLTRKGLEPIAFDHDCREGICGMCGAMVNGTAHGPDKETTLCQLHMRRFKDGDTIVIEPFRTQGFPIVKDLIIDRSALDRFPLRVEPVQLRLGLVLHDRLPFLASGLAATDAAAGHHRVAHAAGLRGRCGAGGGGLLLDGLPTAEARGR